LLAAPISTATGIITYSSMVKDGLSFGKGAKLQILKKPVEADKKWGKWFARVS